jgi:hypothetical protein
MGFIIELTKKEMIKLLMLNDRDLLRQAIESIEPREIFRKMIKGMNGDSKRAFIYYTNIDVKNANPSYVYKHTPYSRKNNIDDVFIFLDSEYKIMGVLKGSTWSSNYSSFERYEKMGTYYHKYSIKKTRKELSEKAFHILMIDSSQIKKINVKLNYSNAKYRDEVQTKKKYKFDVNRNYGYTQRIVQSDFTAKLESYKINKFSHYTTEQIKDITQEILIFFTNRFHDEETIDKVKKYSDLKYVNYNYRISQYDRNPVISFVRNIVNKYDRFITSTNDIHLVDFSDWNDYTMHKFQIIKIYKYFIKKVDNHKK